MRRETLHVKYRPKSFSDVCAQEYTVKILQRQIETETFKNAYLFAGSAGCGKTTCARLFANAINKSEGSPIEIDAASHSGVEDTRAIVEDSRVRALDSYYKVYIIDECHSLSDKAWQSLLVGIEEPPERVIYIFCTTEPQKVPATILSRVQRFDFQRIPLTLISTRLKYICEQEQIKYDQDAIDFIARLADGGMRLAISYLDKVSSYDNYVNMVNTLGALNVPNYKSMFDLTKSIIYQNEVEGLSIINDLHISGKDLKVFISEYLYFILDVNKYISSESFNLIKIPGIYQDELKFIINMGETTRSFYNGLLNKFIQMKETLRWETQVKANLEINFLKLCRSSISEW